MESSIETDSKGRKKVLNACLEPCAIEKGEPVRFNDLTRMLGGASKKMIDQRLKELEVNKMVLRTVISTRPISVTYELTEFGRSALGILHDLRVWSESNILD